MDHIGNLLAAKAMIEAMPNEAFYHRLSNWANREMFEHGPTCGAVGCFGGWIAQDPYFQSLGVRPGPTGAPGMYGVYGTHDLSNVLFLDYSLFKTKQRNERGDEKTIILKRIDAALEQAIERQG